MDTSPFIYFIEEHPRYGHIVGPLLDAVDRGRNRALSSYVTLIEVLTKPIERRREDLSERYRQLLLENPGLRMLPVGRLAAEESARIRAEYRYRMPDAIQLATARLHGADAFVTNDHRLRAFRHVRVMVLDDFVSGPS